MKELTAGGFFPLKRQRKFAQISTPKPKILNTPLVKTSIHNKKCNLNLLTYGRCSEKPVNIYFYLFYGFDIQIS